MRHGAERVASVLGAALLTVGVASCGSSSSDLPGLHPSLPRDPAAVTTEALAHRGEIVSIDEGVQYTPELVEAAGAVKRAVYRSTSGATGQPTEVGGIFAVPKGTPPQGGWPVVSVGHGTTGLEHGCGPSLQPDLTGYASTVTGLLSAGFAVAMSDYEGLDDVGVHPYLEPYSAGYNVIDAARAATKLFPDVSTNWAAMGGSQGGQAAWAANELSGAYGDGLKMVGAVALAPPANIAALAERAYRGELTSEQRSAMPLLIVGLERAGLLPGSAPYLHGSASPTEPGILGCGQQASWQRSQLTQDDLRPDSVAAAEELQRALQLIALPQRALSAPMVVINGTRDEVVLAPWVDYAVHLSCQLGGDIQHVELSTAGHSGEFPYGEIQNWLVKRFAGEPTESNCGD